MSSSSRWRPHFAVWLSTSVLALAAGAAAADPAPPYADLLAQAQSAAPRLTEAEAAVQQAQGLARQAAARPNPTAEVTVENFAASRPLSAADSTETTVQLGQPLELGGKRVARVAAGRAGVEAARARLGETRADYAFSLAVAYAEAEAADRRVALAQESLSLAQEDLRAARALVDAGKEAELRSVQAQAAVTAARAGVNSAQTARAAAFARLTAMAGASVPFTSLAESLLTRADPQAPGPADALSAPAVKSAQAERDAAARRVRVEQTRTVPDVTASLGVRRFSADGSTALVAGLSVPLPLFDRNRGNISAAQAELTAAEARLRAARLNAEAELSTARFETGAARSREAAAREGEATAAEAYRLTRIAYESGKASLVELTAARRALSDARNQTIDAQLERLRADAGFARLQGRPPFGIAQ
jgi:cobalt-zinc-cadmium efflux system outer membrane protein